MFNTIKRIANKVVMYLGLVDDIVIDFLMDIKSLRYQLILWAYIFNGFVMYLIYEGKADYKLATASIALLTLVYGMYFHSKKAEAELNAKATSLGSGDPENTEKDPDNIP